MLDLLLDLLLLKNN